MYVSKYLMRYGVGRTVNKAFENTYMSVLYFSQCCDVNFCKSHELSVGMLHLCIYMLVLFHASYTLLNPLSWLVNDDRFIGRSLFWILIL